MKYILIMKGRITMSNIAIIFAGGSGVRMGTGLPKQFIEVNGKPIIIHTLDSFEENEQIDEIYIACKEDYIKKLQKLIRRFQIEKVKAVIAGGNSAQESIYNAIMEASKTNVDKSIILIHDGVRPFINSELINSNIESVKEYGSAITCTPLYETPIISKDGKLIDELPSREASYKAQAPQSFYLGEVIEAHKKIREENSNYEGIVDTCTLMKNAGYKVSLVAGPRGNIKVTTPEDLFIFKAMMEYRATQSAFGLNEKELEDRLQR